MKKLLLILSALSVSAIILTGCACKHEKWNDADCTTPKTCAKCGETEGVPLGHTWKDASCKSPKTCEVCGETEGDLGEHKWKDATCEVPKTCTVCGETDGTKIEHEWIEASCKSPKTCKLCNITEGEKADSHKWVEATCKEAKHCSVCGEKSGELLGHDWEEATCKQPKTCKVCFETEGTVSNDHKWIDATCEKPKECEICGKTEGSSKSHDWSSATCTEPRRCSYCGKTDGEARGHSYISNKCSRCGQPDPRCAEILSACSLSLPSLPITLNEYDYRNNIKTTVVVTDISYNFEVWKVDEGTVILNCKFSGYKTYDARGSGQSSPCKVGWKLYDSNGNVFQSGTFSSSSVAEGESFASNREENLIYNFNATQPGAFRLELLNTN